MENVNTCICGASDAAILARPYDLYSGEQFTIIKCRSCGLGRLSPRPAPDEIGRYYRDDYFPFMRTGGLLHRLQNMQWRMTSRLLARHARVQGPVLEFGCGTGDILNLVQRATNRDAYGLDFSALAVKEAKLRYPRLDISESSGAGLSISASGFSLIYMRHVIEHLYFPSMVIRELIAKLAPGGRLIIITPDAGSLEAHLFGRYWHFDVPRHLWFFHRRHILQMLEKTGLHVRQIRYEYNPLNWIWGLRQFAFVKFHRKDILSFLHPRNLWLSMFFFPLNAILSWLGESGRMMMVFEKGLSVHE
jgi:2-polyprenyl-3-methyl-5-hydroxy-6-metoxy-1,4-benzoquinol methylase